MGQVGLEVAESSNNFLESQWRVYINGYFPAPLARSMVVGIG